jgi:hypothetical protein
VRNIENAPARVWPRLSLILSALPKSSSSTPALIYDPLIAFDEDEVFLYLGQVTGLRLIANVG